MSTAWEWQGLVQSRLFGNPRRKAVMNLLGAAADEEGHSYWSIGRMSAAVEVSTKTVGRILSEMEQAGFLRRKRRVKANGQYGVYDVWLDWSAIFALPLTPWQSKKAKFQDPPEEASVPLADPKPEEPKVPMAKGTQSSDGHENPGFRAELQKRTSTENSSGDGALFADSPSHSNGKTATKRDRATPIGDHFIVTPDMRSWANREVPAVDIDRETAQFIDHWKANGKPHVDWVAAWRKWLRNAVKFAKERAGPVSGVRKAEMGTGPIRTKVIQL